MKFEVKHKSYGDEDTYTINVNEYKLIDNDEEYTVIIKYTANHLLEDIVELKEDCNFDYEIKINSKEFNLSINELEHMRILLKLLDNIQKPSQDISLHWEL